MAAIQKLEARGADVRWDDRINGRQFDVTVRVKKGEDEGLTVIECRDLSKKVLTEAVESFVTKARDVNASRAIMVSGRGFSRGAREVARRHGVGLWILRESVRDWPACVLRHDRVPAVNVREVQFFGPDGIRYTLPGPEEDVLPSTVFRGPNGESASFEAMLRAIEPEILQALREEEGPVLIDYNVPQGARAVFPGRGEVPVVRLTFEARWIIADQPILATPPVNVHHLRTYEYVDALSGETRTFDGLDLPLGFDTVFRPGALYRSRLGLLYKCLAVSSDDITMLHFDPRFRIAEELVISPEHAPLYVEITYRDEINELEAFLGRATRPQEGSSTAPAAGA